jgi:uncharacterized membrane protein required for colicin V production
MGLLGLFGLFRGVRRGLIAVAGTLLGAVLIDLWQARWSGWLGAQMEQPTWATFLLTATIFLLVALLVGYGGSLLLPHDPRAKGPGLFDRFLGAFVGALNGALIVSYMLRYANENWTDGEAANLIADSLVAGLLDAWLPWFILAMVLSTTVFVMLRGTMRVSRALSRRADVATDTTAGTAGAAASGTKTPPPAAPSVTPKEVAASDRRFLDKIDQTSKK